jgi:hypothetical protein
MQLPRQFGIVIAIADESPVAKLTLGGRAVPISCSRHSVRHRTHRLSRPALSLRPAACGSGLPSQALSAATVRRAARIPAASRSSCRNAQGRAECGRKDITSHRRRCGF